jgi:protocatechuate 4,5-dioxygenase beta chain
MAELISITGTHHNPLLPRLFQDPGKHPGIPQAQAAFDELRERLEADRADVLLVVANDHLNEIFLDRMPPFMVGKGRQHAGPFDFESKIYGLARREFPGHPALAEHLVRFGFEWGADLAFSDECTLDHAFMIPLHYLQPDGGIPIVPFFANVMAPPYPPLRRYHAIGRMLADAIRAFPEELRVAVVSSGHLSVEVGGPKPPTAAYDAAFDTEIMRLIEARDLDALFAYATPERMLEAGNMTQAFSTFVLLAGLAGDLPLTYLRHVFMPTSTLPFLRWETEGEAV